MKRFRLLVPFALGAVLLAVQPAGAAPPADDGVNGGFQMTVHTHSSNPATLLFPSVDRLEFGFEEGSNFAYSSRTCDRNAPFNQVGLDFTPDYPGVDDATSTAAVRHQVTGTVTEVHGKTGTIEGTITTVLCENGQATSNVIVTNFEARYRLASDDQLRIMGTYQFSPTASTGTFAGLEGQGSIQASFTCLGSTTCSDIGVFTDFVAARGDLTAGPGVIKPGLVGNYSDPTVTAA